jgi:hypothetical protein
MTQPQQDPVQPLSFLLTLGDIVDGYGDDDSYSTAAKTDKDLKQVVGLISSGLQGVPARHVLGNHCLAAPRSELLEVRCLLAGTDDHVCWEKKQWNHRVASAAEQHPHFLNVCRWMSGKRQQLQVSSTPARR